MCKKEYKTTVGVLQFKDGAEEVESVDDPKPPEGEGWSLRQTSLSHMWRARVTILWSWERSAS